MTTSDDSDISEDRREALRYALAIGSGAALASAIAGPASAQATADNTLDRIRANKVLRIAVLPGELPYFNKDLAAGTLVRLLHRHGERHRQAARRPA